MNTTTPSRPTTRRRPESHSGVAKTIATARSIDPIRVLRRHILGIILATMFGSIFGIGSHFALSYQKLKMIRYSGDVTFEVQPGIPGASQIGSIDFTNDDVVDRLCKNHTVILGSREVLSQATKSPEIANTEWVKKFIVPDEKGEEVIDWQEAIDELEDDINTPTIRGTSFFQVQWSTYDKQDVPTVLNAISAAYMERVKQQDTAIYNENIVAFRSQLNDTQLKLDMLAKETKQFIRDEGITTLDDSRYSQYAKQLDAITQQAAQAASQLSFARSMYQQTAAKLTGEIEPSEEDILTSEMDSTIGSHLQMLVTLKAELRRRMDKYRPDNPMITDIEASIRATEAEVEAKKEEIIRRNLNATLKIQGNQIEQLEQLLVTLDRDGEVAATRLEELAAQHSEYESMENRRDYLLAARDADLMMIKEVQLMRARADANRVRLILRAEVPREPSFPRWEIMIPLGVFLFAGGFVGIVFIREITDQRVKSASDLAVMPGINVLGAIPECIEDPTSCPEAELVVVKHPDSVLAESYRQVFAHMLRVVQRAGHQTILLMGGLPGAGSSTAISNLAACTAASGNKVLVMDANFRRPRLASAMGVSDDQIGLGDWLTDEATIEDAIQKTSYGIDVISAGTPAQRIIERFNTEKLDSLLALLRSKYDVVYLDAPPAVVAGETMVLANKVDATMLIIRANHEHRGLVARLVNQLGDMKSEMLGLLLNRPRGTAGGYFKKNYEAMAKYASNPYASKQAD